MNYSRAYLHHLIKTEEVLGWHLLGLHNLHFYRQLMVQIRNHILSDTFLDFYHANRMALQQTDGDFEGKESRKPRVKKKVPLSLGDYEVHSSEQGFFCIKQKSSGEIMHSVNDPETEARRLYIEQSRLEERLKEPNPSELIIWDVGLGAGTNAMAVIRYCEKLAQESFPNREFVEGQKSEGFEGLSGLRSVHLVSFENNLDSIRLALRHPSLFTHLRHGAPHELLQSFQWESKVAPLRWTLISGDFKETLEEAPTPDLVYYDPFSYKTDSELWTLGCFQKVFQKCQNHATEIFTYSASTAVRAGLLGAGFFVAKGVGTGPKSETTIALTPLARKASHQLLGSSWLERWSRSGSKYPFGLPIDEQARFTQQIYSQINQYS
jgi:queuine tRNA-ribosyltransferase